PSMTAATTTAPTPTASASASIQPVSVEPMPHMASAMPGSIMQSANPVPSGVQPLGCGKDRKPPTEGPENLVKYTRNMGYAAPLFCILPLILMIPVEPDMLMALAVEEPDDWELSWDLAYKILIKIAELIVNNSSGSGGSSSGGGMDLDTALALMIIFFTFIQILLVLIGLNLALGGPGGIKKRLPYIKDAKAAERNKTFMVLYKIFMGCYTVQVVYELILFFLAGFNMFLDVTEMSFTVALPFRFLRTLAAWACIPLAIGMAYHTHQIPEDAPVLGLPEKQK
ncbi:hypothetical protein KIPB_009736, partial [Kipferlia bialata]